MNELDYPQKLLDVGDKSGASIALFQLLRKNPNDIDAWLLLAQAVDEKEKKADCYRQVLKIDPDNLNAQNLLISILPKTKPLTEKGDDSKQLEHSIKPNEENKPKLKIDLKINFIDKFGRPLAFIYDFCRSCGKEISPDAITCPFCGANLPGFYTKCPYCGSSEYIADVNNTFAKIMKRSGIGRKGTFAH